MTEFPTPDVWLPHRVSYGETDAMGVVYYAQYLHFFERARSEYIRTRTGVSYRMMEERGIALPVREAICRYRRPGRYDELIFIRAGIEKWGRATVRFVYEVRDESRESLLATGMTEHAFVNMSGKPVRIPVWTRELFGLGEN